MKVKEVMIQYFDELSNMYKFLAENPKYKMISYKFTFAYGYQLCYVEK